MTQLTELDHGSTFRIMNHINHSLAQGDRVIDGALPRLPLRDIATDSIRDGWEQ